MSQTRSAPHVIIIGAGPGGLALAQGLKKQHIPFTLYERDRARNDYVQGFRLRVRQRGLDALRECLPQALYSAVLETAGRAPAHSRSVDEQLQPLQNPFQREADDALVEHSVSRVTLRQILLCGLEAHLHTAKVYSHYHLLDDGRVRAFFEDGSHADADLLVGADGPSSRVRQQLLPQAAIYDTGIVRFAGKLELQAARDLQLPAYFFDHNLSVRASDGTHLMLTSHLSPAPRQIAGYDIGQRDPSHHDRPGLHFDNQASYLWWNTAFPRQRVQLPARQPGQQQLLEVQRLLAGWHPQLLQLIRHSQPDTVAQLPVRTSQPVAPWSSGPVTLLGDAIHSMTYFRALGANSALYDAGVLTRRLAEAVEHGTDRLHAVATYEQAMREHGFANVDASLQALQRTQPITLEALSPPQPQGSLP